MPKTIYGIKAPNMPLDFMFAIDPSSLCENREDYACLNRRIGLKKDLGWREKHLKHLLCQGNIWQDFPTKGYTMVGCEFQPGGEDQRVDILYIRNDGGLLLCELKIGGKSLDAHGQLIRIVEQANIAHHVIDNSFKLKMEELTHRRIVLVGFYETVNAELERLHIERVKVLEMAQLAQQKSFEKGLPIEERQLYKDMAIEMTKELPHFGDKANESLKQLVQALPPVEISSKLLES